MEFRDELEEAGGLSKQQIEDRVRVRRAQLTVEAERGAEREAGAAAKKGDPKPSSSRWAGPCPLKPSQACGSWNK